MKAQETQVAPNLVSDTFDNTASVLYTNISKQERRERAVREREAQVSADRQKVEADIGRSQMGLNREEDEGLFR